MRMFLYNRILMSPVFLTGMQSSLLALALANKFFPDPLVGVPPAVSVCDFFFSLSTCLLRISLFQKRPLWLWFTDEFVICRHAVPWNRTCLVNRLTYFLRRWFRWNFTFGYEISKNYSLLFNPQHIWSLGMGNIFWIDFFCFLQVVLMSLMGFALVMVWSKRTDV